MDTYQVDGEVRLFVTVDVAKDFDSIAKLGVAQLTGLATELALADECEALVPTNGFIGIDSLEIDPFFLRARKIEDRIAPFGRTRALSPPFSWAVRDGERLDLSFLRPRLTFEHSLKSIPRLASL